MEQEKEVVIQKFIELLPFENWNFSTLEKACENCSFTKDYAKILYPAGIEGFTYEFGQSCNVEALKSAEEIIIKNSLKTSEKAEEIIFQKIFTYHKKLKNLESLKKFISNCVMPNLALTAGKGVFEFSDKAWRLMGDNATDFSFYTKRASFSGIYLKSMLYSMSDNSENLIKTRNYIKKSIDGLMKFHKLKGKIKNIFEGLPFNFKR
ncbi:MAG: COQ9 family protein [Rickettsiales bacterium]|nr:COQ9 family protein [Rickettsiales bacterium]